MNPVIDQAKEHFSEQLKLIRYKGMSKERLRLTRHFLKKVDMNYIPTVVLADSSDRILSYGKGYIRKDGLYRLIEEGLEKAKKLAHLKISKLIFICRNSLAGCQSSQSEIQSWLGNVSKNSITLDAVDLDQIENGPEMNSFYSKLSRLKYLYGLDHIPAVIACSKEDEVIAMVQNLFTRKDLEGEFQGFYDREAARVNSKPAKPDETQ